MSERSTKALIMAAGQSTRMKSATSKVLHEVCGKPILQYVFDACRGAGIEELVVIVGHQKEQLIDRWGDDPNVTWVTQEPQLGTAHAVMVARDAIEGFEGDLVVLVGDAPMIRPKTVETLITTHRDRDAAVTLVTSMLDDPKWFGRIVRDEDGDLKGIVEAKEAGPEELAIKEVNPSYYAFRWDALDDVLDRIGNDNAKGEYYLTDAIGLLIEEGRKAEAVPAAQPEEVQAVNSRADLALVSKLMRQRVLGALMAEGVTIEDPDSTYVDWGVTVGQDTVIRPGVVIRSGVEIGRNCVVGPYAHLRPGTVLEDGAETGAFVETKNARLGKGVCARHLAYLGDVDVGDGTNVGCGTITANSDPQRRKHHTTVGRDAYLGAGTILIAPTSVGKGGVTGAGSVVTSSHPVGEGQTVAGVPAKPLDDGTEGGKE